MVITHYIRIRDRVRRIEVVRKASVDAISIECDQAEPTVAKEIPPLDSTFELALK